MAIVGIPFLLITAFALLVAYVYLRRKKDDPRYPPGPRALPIVGNIFQLLGNSQETLMNWGKQFGSIYSLNLVGEKLIVLNDAKLIKEVFSDQSSTGRSTNPVLLAFAGGGNNGVIMNEGPHWEAQRRFTLRKLRDFGFAKSAMEGMILEEANSLLHWFGKRLDQPISGNRLFNGPVVNSLWNIISGERSEWDAPKTPEILDGSEELINALSKVVTSGLFYAPIMRFISPGFFGWTRWVKSIANMSNITNKSIERHKANLNKDNPTDFIDHYLIEKEEATDPKSSFYGETGDKNLTAVIPDLFLAGSETTSHTLSWALLFLGHHPNVQKKLQEELDTVLGDRQPSIADKPNLPYTEAVILELLRKPAIASNGVHHRMIEDAVFQGYFFPKGVAVMSNIFWAHNNPEVWGDPENFRPERFLSEDGTKIMKHEALIPFSLGKRQCLGKALAEDTLFIFITCLFQKYTVKPDPDGGMEAIKEKNIIPNSNLVNSPRPFKVIVSQREVNQ